MNPNRRQLNVLIAVALVACVYLWTAPRGVMTDDSAEFQTLCVTMGQTHAPGYPLLLCVGKLFSLLPLGEIAFRLTLMSVFFGVATVWLFMALMARVTDSIPAALVGGLALAFSHTFWMESLLAEAYSLNAFLVVAILALMWTGANRRAAWSRAFCAAALITGAGFGNHQTLILFTPVVVLWFWWSARKRHAMASAAIARATGMAVLCGAVGLAVYAVLAIRYAAFGIGLRESLWWARGGPAQGLLFAFGPAELAGRLAKFIAYSLYQFAGPVLILVVIGVAAAWRRQRAWLAALGGFWLVTALWGLNFDSSDIYVFYIPAYVIMAVTVAMGYAALERWMRERGARSVWMISTALVFGLGAIVAPVLTYRAALNAMNSGGAALSANKGNRYYLWPPKRDAVWMGAEVRTLLDAAPHNGLLVSNWSYASAARYYQTIEHARRDVEIFNGERNRRGDGSWARRVRDWFRDTPATSVIMTGADDIVSARYHVEPFGGGYAVWANALARMDVLNMRQTHESGAIAWRGRLFWIGPITFDAANIDSGDAQMTITARERPFAAPLPVRRPLHDHAGRSNNLITRGDSPTSGAAAEGALLLWTAPRFLEDGTPVESGLYEARVESGGWKQSLNVR